MNKWQTIFHITTWHKSWKKTPFRPYIAEWSLTLPTASDWARGLQHEGRKLWCSWNFQVWSMRLFEASIAIWSHHVIMWRKKIERKKDPENSGKARNSLKSYENLFLWSNLQKTSEEQSRNWDLEYTKTQRNKVSEKQPSAISASLTSVLTINSPS